MLLRRLMQMDSKPAVVVLNGYRMSDRKNPEGGTRGVERRTGQEGGGRGRDGGHVGERRRGRRPAVAILGPGTL